MIGNLLYRKSLYRIISEHICDQILWISTNIFWKINILILFIFFIHFIEFLFICSIKWERTYVIKIILNLLSFRNRLILEKKDQSCRYIYNYRKFQETCTREYQFRIHSYGITNNNYSVISPTTANPKSANLGTESESSIF